MPERTAIILSQESSSNSLPNIIPQLAILLNRDPDLRAARLCTSVAVQVAKLPHEGPYFCGYRNLQTLCLALGASTSISAFEHKLTIPALQVLIEAAWAKGFNAHARLQTGGVKDTRKFIGPSEVEAVLLSFGVSCRGQAFTGRKAWVHLLDALEMYFAASPTATTLPPDKVTLTTRMPVFLQRPRHSVTIVGIERNNRGKRRVLVFDPAWRPPAAISKDGAGGKWEGRMALKRYRKSERYFKKFSAFEVLWVD